MVCLSVEPAAAQRAGQFVRPVGVVAPLIGVCVPVRGAGHLARRPRPVGGIRHGLPAGQRAHLLLTDIVSPAAAVAPHRAGQHQQRQHRAVDHVAVEPVADAAAHDDHRAAAGFLCVAGEFLGDSDGLGRRHTGDRFLPGRGVLLGGVVVAGGPLAGQSLAPHRVVGQHQVEHRAHQVLADPAHRDAACARSSRGRRRCRSWAGRAQFRFVTRPADPGH